MAEAADRVVQRIFRVWSAVYDRPIFQRTFYRRVHAALLEMCDGPAPRRALDLGCGTGQLTADLAARWPGALVAGADLSHEMLAAGRRRLGEGAPPFAQANVYALPFADGAFDLVTSTISYHFYKEPQRALGEIRRVLAPGGRLLLATLSTELLRLAALRRTLELGMADRVRLRPPDQVRGDLEQAGLAVKRLAAVRPGVRVFEAIRT